MERYSMFLGRKNQYFENNYTTKCNLQIQCDPYQITNAIFHRTRTKISQFIWKYKRPRIIKAVLRKTGAGAMELEESISWLQIILQSYSHQDRMVLAQKQKYRAMEQDRNPRKKLIHLWVSYFWQRRQEYTMGKRQPLQ